MEKPSIPVAGGLGAAAILAFALNPWTNQNANVSNEAPVTPNGATSGGPPANGTASATPYSLSENEQGPWYALCKVFATIDPEDTEKESDHPLREESGIQIHPPTSRRCRTVYRGNQGRNRHPNDACGSSSAQICSAVPL